MLRVNIDDKRPSWIETEREAAEYRYMGDLAIARGFTASWAGWAMQPRPHGEAGVAHGTHADGDRWTIQTTGPTPMAAVRNLLSILAYWPRERDVNLGAP